MVEAAGVEPASENTPLPISTCLVLCGCLSCLTPSRTRGFRHYPTEFRLSCGRRARKAIPLVDVLSGRAGVGRKTGSI